MPMLEETVLKATPKNDRSRFTQEEAKRKLQEVRSRYGIQDLDPQAGPRTDMHAPLRGAKQQPRPTVEPQPTASKARTVPVERMRSEPDLELQKARLHNLAANASPPDQQIFHYLIQIAECTAALHCEVTAECEPNARHYVKQIPNLLGWREISGAELAEIIKDEKLVRGRTNKARFSGRIAAAF
jgi:hypothetical protein